MSLPTPTDTVEKLQQSLHAKAKTEPNFRFYSLVDKIYRLDVLKVAYGRCRANRGAPGADGETFEMIEAQGLETWLGLRQKELREGTYRPQPLRRVWIPKANGEPRPLGIPTIKDRVCQMAAVLIFEPIFEADFLPSQYGFRPKLGAKMAIRRVFFHLTQEGRREVVDVDLSDYFNSIPHGPLMKSVSRRVSDGKFLQLLKSWIEMSVVEELKTGAKRTTQAKDEHRSTPQGSPISPLLANVYFRRFILAWKKFGLEQKYDAHIVNYADDFVICTKPGNGELVMNEMRKLIERIGLTVNEKKTRLVTIPVATFDFLGYTFGQMYRHKGPPFIGTRPSKKSVKRVMDKIHYETEVRWVQTPVDKRVLELNRIVRGWSNYFNQGPVLPTYGKIQKHMERRLRKWLVRKHKGKGTGYRQYSDEYLYEELGLIKLPISRAGLSRAKA
ncbi:group II intron reverse transcriptase/maturase [Candidatus Dependentiae bacterium]|nr:group II intron reverse transcriptase/maturase [Candidatus Dependentiae bacterium]